VKPVLQQASLTVERKEIKRQEIEGNPTVCSFFDCGKKEIKRQEIEGNPTVCIIFMFMLHGQENENETTDRDVDSSMEMEWNQTFLELESDSCFRSDTFYLVR
jgi:hypothetical protein